MVKHAVIADLELVATLDSAWDSLLDRDDDTLSSLIPDIARIKVEIVGEDEREAGVRALLNFGHTFAHAIELTTGYGTLSHGEAVAIGMRAAVHLSASVAQHEAFSPDSPLPDSLHAADRLIARLDPPSIPVPVTNRQIVEAMTTDKKRTHEGLRLIVLERTGEARIATQVPREWIEQALAYARSAGPETVT